MFQGHQEGFYVFCSLSPGVGSRGRLVYVVCPLVHPEKGPRGRLVFLYVVCLPVLWEGLRRKTCLSLCSLAVREGLKGKTHLSSCSLSPGKLKWVPGKGFYVPVWSVPWCTKSQSWECHLMFKCMVITDPVMVTTDPVMVTTGQSFVLVLYLLWLPQTQSVLGMSPNVQVHGYHAQIQSWLPQANPFFFYNILCTYGNGYTHSIS